MLLMGHEGDIFSTKFHPDGEILVSAGFDRSILVWNVYGECENIAKLTGHHGAIMDMHWSNDGDYLYTASTDKTLGIWDAEYGVKIKKLKGTARTGSNQNPSKYSSSAIVDGKML